MSLSETKAYKLSALENDLTFAPSYSFFLDNTEDDTAFLTYVLPYRLKEYLEKSPAPKGNAYMEKLYKAAENAGDEGNPILIEYKVTAIP